MPKLLIIADDLTGALDTGVKFSQAGLRTVILTRRQDVCAADDADVTVLCAETRHLSGEEAYGEIRSIAEENAARFPLLMKKTDSGLRGNIGAELQALMDGAHESCLAFLPALPEMDRITRGGVQYIDGVPVSQSVFGRDPFEPVLDDDVPSMLRRHCTAPVRVIPRGQAATGDDAILVCDAETADDMRASVGQILRDGKIRLLAGCAGLAQALAGELARDAAAPCEPEEKEPLLVVCGSVNRISQQQLEYAERAGVARYHMPLEYLLGETEAGPTESFVLERCASSLPVMVDTFAEEPSECPISQEMLEDRRRRISRRLGGLVKTVMDRDVRRRIMIIGGDTLSALMDAIGCTALMPLCEPDRGVVLSELRYNGRRWQILSKSGGFGTEDLLTRL